MASATRVYKARKRIKQRKRGLKRKNELNRKGSTPTRHEFFGDSEPTAAQQ
jgi:hypothetical protein